MTNGIIEPDSPRGKEIGFTSDRFDGYLWKEKGRILVSFIESKRRGNFRELVARIHALGLAVSVPTPMGRMQSIVIRNGYRLQIEDDPVMKGVHVWTLPPPLSAQRANLGPLTPLEQSGAAADK